MHFLFTFINKSCIMYKLNSKGGTISLPKRWHHARKKKFYMTTAIAYASGKPHIGNTYEIVFSDLIARAKRMEGYDVFFKQVRTSTAKRSSSKRKPQV